MNQPTDRMLIDALCICEAVRRGSIDLLELSAAELGVVKWAREIVGEHSRTALARIKRDLQDVESPELTDDQLGNLQPAVLKYHLKDSGDRLFATAGQFEIDTVNTETIEFLRTALRQGQLVHLRCPPIVGIDALPRPLLVTSELEQPNGFRRFVIKHIETPAAEAKDTRLRQAPEQPIVTEIERGGEFTTRDPVIVQTFHRYWRQETPVSDLDMQRWLKEHWTLPVEGRKYFVTAAQEAETENAWTFTIAEAK